MILSPQLHRWRRQLYDNPYILLTLTAFFFGGNTIAGRLAVGEASPYQIVTLRWIVVFMILCVWQRGRMIEAWRQARPRALWIFLMGTLGLTLFNTLFYEAAHRTSAVNLGIIQGTIPVWVLLGSLVFYGVRFGVLQGVGVLLTAAGAILLASQGDLVALIRLNINNGDFMMFIACFIYAGYTVALKKRPPLSSVLFFSLLAGAALLSSLPLMCYELFFSDVPWPTTRGWGLIVLIALFPSFLSHVFYIRGIEILGPGRAGVFINLVPVFAVLLAVLLLDEPIFWFQGIALLLVLLGIWLAEKRAKRDSY
ncbi:DMT family transporter [Candidatus Persebacteraceae bacterium Df01]|jgi:drug/metabolite transporter (DMT)-like permease|uniref:DMT family transporter n=1 Tax=Candidatus Doriopsillibacter californiensis TaxID=2970740 RepID=A0ABT7QKW2_9GAMM|nr:DMT family transporter [Candidatus Persebacteraceae bacterium Df01]